MRLQIDIALEPCVILLDLTLQMNGLPLELLKLQEKDADKLERTEGGLC